MWLSSLTSKTTGEVRISASQASADSVTFTVVQGAGSNEHRVDGVDYPLHLGVGHAGPEWQPQQPR